MNRPLERIMVLLVILLALSFICGAKRTTCEENYAARVAIAKEIGRLQRQADVIWPQGGVCNDACQALEKRIGGLLDDQLYLQAVGEYMHCPLHPEGE